MSERKVFLLIGALAAVGGILTVFAFWSMGRQAYRKN